MQENSFCLKAENRLKKADEFSSVFLFKRAIGCEYFKIHYKPNNLNYSRLGLVVSKKTHKRAVKRNYIKRVFRELFRTNTSQWEHYDIVIRSLKCFTQSEFAKIESEFSRITYKLKIK